MPEDDRERLAPPEKRAGKAKKNRSRLRRMGRLHLLRSREPHFAWEKLSLLATPLQRSPLRGLTQTRVKGIIGKHYQTFDWFFEMAETLGGKEALATMQQAVFWNENLLYLKSLRICCLIAGLSPSDIAKYSGREFVNLYFRRRFNSWNLLEMIKLGKFCDIIGYDWLHAETIIARDVKWSNFSREVINGAIRSQLRPEEPDDDGSQDIPEAGDEGLRDGTDFEPDRDGSEDAGRVVEEAEGSATDNPEWD